MVEESSRAQRQDGASMFRLDVARGKAWASVAMGASSRALFTRAKDNPNFFVTLAATAIQCKKQHGVSHGSKFTLRSACVAAALKLHERASRVAAGLTGARQVLTAGEIEVILNAEQCSKRKPRGSFVNTPALPAADRRRADQERQQGRDRRCCGSYYPQRWAFHCSCSRSRSMAGCYN